jgi:hypothetical protein
MQLHPRQRTHGIRSDLRLRKIALLVVIGAAATSVGGLAANAGVRAQPRATSPRAHAAASKPYTASVSYRETNHGRSKGSATVGIQGKGSFSAKLSPRLALEAAVIALATGVPVSEIARGGTYKLQRDIAGDGSVKGLIVARFTVHGLGSLCLSYTEKPGKYTPGMPFVPMSGAIKTVGGTSQAATWRAAIKFKQTNITSPPVEQIAASGSEHVSTGKAKPMTGACKRVARI